MTTAAAQPVTTPTPEQTLALIARVRAGQDLSANPAVFAVEHALRVALHAFDVVCTQSHVDELLARTAKQHARK